MVIPDADSMNPLYDISLKTSNSNGQLEESPNVEKLHGDNVKMDTHNTLKVQQSLSADSVTSQVSSSFEAGCPRGDCMEKIVCCITYIK